MVLAIDPLRPLRLRFGNGTAVVLFFCALCLGLPPSSLAAPSQVGGPALVPRVERGAGGFRPGCDAGGSPSAPIRLPAGLASRAAPDLSGKLAAGKFLVASRRLDDPNFVRTVVLLLHYDAGGAMGLVVNRPTTMELSKILPEVEELQGLNDALYIGGPVALDGIMLLIRAPKPPEGASNIFDGVHATGKLSTLREMTRRAEESTTFRAYAGHAGWGPGQLDREVALGGWHVVPAEVCAIFDTPASQVWPALIDRVSGSWARAKTRQPGS